MKLSKALKLKNQLAGEVATLKDLFTSQNVRPAKQKFDYDNREVLTRLQGKQDELVRVKATIAAANREVYEKIFRMAELKGLVVTLTGVDTKAGVFNECYGGGRGAYSTSEVEYVAQISKVEIDKVVATVKEEIQSLQDALDEFNSTRSVEL